MKIIALILLAVVLLCGCHRPPKVQLWDYRVMVVADDSKEMAEYRKKNGDISNALSAYDAGTFHLLRIKPDPNEPFTKWELVTAFVEPAKINPHVILIFKRPL